MEIIAEDIKSSKISGNAVGGLITEAIAYFRFLFAFRNCASTPLDCQGWAKYLVLRKWGAQWSAANSTPMLKLQMLLRAAGGSGRSSDAMQNTRSQLRSYPWTLMSFPLAHLDSSHPSKRNGTTIQVCAFHFHNPFPNLLLIPQLEGAFPCTEFALYCYPVFC